MHVPVSGHYACIHKVAGEYACRFYDFAVVIQPGFVDSTPEQVPINFVSDVSEEPIQTFCRSVAEDAACSLCILCQLPNCSAGKAYSFLPFILAPVLGQTWIIILFSVSFLAALTVYT